MKRITHYTLLFILISLIACHSNTKETYLTFQVDLSKVIDKIDDPKTVGLIGTRPLLDRFERKPMTKNGEIFQTKILIPDSLKGTKLIYAFIVDSSRIENERYEPRELLLPKQSTVLPVVQFDDKVGSTGDKILPSPPIPVFRANTPAEKAILAKPFVGITTNGEPLKNLFSIESTGFPTSQIKSATLNFLATLSKEQLAQCTFDITDDEWRKWHNIEIYERQGIGLFEMNENQKELAFKLLEVSLSPKGLKKTKDIMAMEGYLNELSLKLGYVDEERALKLGSDLYYFTFMGIPSDHKPWGWQLDGHHIVINYFILGDQIVMTPTFMGSEPNYIEDGPNKGIRTFEQEELKGLQFYNSLDENQKTLATLHSEKEYSFAQAEAFKDNQIIPYVGLQVNNLASNQKDLLLDLIQEYVGNMRDHHASVKMNEVVAHIDQTWFSWVGGSDDTSPFYYRIHSPVILIEFDHQGPTFLWDYRELYPGPHKKHVHTVVRTPNGNDYGKDLLRQHLEEHHH